MNTTNKLTVTLLLLVLLPSCSRDYTPDISASGEQIYQAACSECHQPDADGMIFKINGKNSNPTYVAHKVKSGSLMMPSFPKMKADDLKKLSAYVLAHSNIE